MRLYLKGQRESNHLIEGLLPQIPTNYMHLITENWYTIYLGRPLTVLIARRTFATKIKLYHELYFKCE